ncbi:hypothetical protein AMTRI_Chr07g74860 [Amborella trichopoda]|uniref:Ricin B lectin domain-containing protein n=1 Tax=Amborella trichopoda TaxID=13333 RepID=W1PL23_AMBTC|nr:ricin B-like lectin R40G3 [Amborella trichopoda]ERN08381.1 hypothetical protein AMTR_s00148p00065520 [Amborella trichopoda]|eukprot:XP_006846800.1 ricin B-like lectin R40G3 [Amborella trichopoda]
MAHHSRTQGYSEYDCDTYADGYAYSGPYVTDDFGCEGQIQPQRPLQKMECKTYEPHNSTQRGFRKGPVLPQGQTVKLTSKGNTDFALGVRNGQVVMVYYNPNDLTQQWIKDESWSNSVNDSVGHPAFCLVNKATGKALRHAPGAFQQVLLTNYEPGSFEDAVMWTQSQDFGGGYKTIRMANNIHLNLDCFQGDLKHGGIKDGNQAVLWTWNGQDNQLWKINPSY